MMNSFISMISSSIVEEILGVTSKKKVKPKAKEKKGSKTKVKKLLPPTSTKMPFGLTKKAIAYWPDFWSRHGKAINKVPDVGKRWAAAIAIFRNSCTKRNIPPFEVGTKVNKDAKEAFSGRIDSARAKQAANIVSLIKRLKRKGLISSIGKEIIDEVSYDTKNKGYSITTRISLKKNPKMLDKAFSSNFKAVLDTLGYKKKGSGYVLDNGTRKVFIESDKVNLEVVNQTLFNPQVVKFIIGINDEALKDKAFVTKELAKKAKASVKNTAIKKAMFASPAQDLNKINFSESLSEEDQKNLDNASSKWTKKDINRMVNDYDISYIRSLGTPIYQYNLVKKMLEFFKSQKEEPMALWNSIVEDPTSYLDPKFYIPIERDSEIDPRTGM